MKEGTVKAPEGASENNKFEAIDKLVFIGEHILLHLTKMSAYGVEMKYPNGEPLEAKYLSELDAAKVEPVYRYFENLEKEQGPDPSN